MALPENPVSKIKKPAPGKARERRITLEELERLRTALAKCRNRLLSNIVMFAIHTGMRRGEILSIRWSDINFDATPPIWPTPRRRASNGSVKLFGALRSTRDG